MTEQEYIRATNLARVSAALNFMRIYAPEGEAEERERFEIIARMSAIEERLARKVVVDE